MSPHDDVSRFVEELIHHDGFAPFSEAKLTSLQMPEARVLVAEDGEIVGIGAVATHPQADGSVHSALETAVAPSMRFPAFEGAVLDAALTLLPHRGQFGVWSNRTTLDTALLGRGFEPTRVLDYLAVDLPIAHRGESSVPPNVVRAFTMSDCEGIVTVNNVAFADHREASSLTMADMGRYTAKDWFNADGIFVVGDPECVGFCWTRVHPDGDGEIYRIAVSPEYQGKGIGFDLLSAGFEYLAGRDDVRRGTLWMDRSNRAAAMLYRSIGMELQRSNTEFLEQ